MTYHPLKDDSLQDIFNKAYLGLKSQGFAKCAELCVDEYSGEEEYNCLYTLDGKHCAIGWVCEGSKQLPEDTAITKKTLAKHLAFVPPESRILFLHKLQVVHDGAISPEHMQERLKHFAKLYDLTVPE